MQEVFPLLGFDLHKGNSAPLDLSKWRLSDLGIDPMDSAALSDYIYSGRIRYGGYGELRSIYGHTSLFATEEKERNIHLGIDLWEKAGTKVHSPWEATVISAQDNDAKGDYGPTLILAHDLNGQKIHSLYGHLSKESLRHHPGDRIHRGEVIADFGTSDVNGGWPPHLHFQLIYDLHGMTGDYPGVCNASDWDHYHSNCPDPFDFGLCP